MGGAPKDKGQENRRQDSLQDQSQGIVDWEFGQIKEVDTETSMVKVVIFRGEKKLYEIPGWHPVFKGQESIRIIQEQYGRITSGMCVIVHWRGSMPEVGKTFVQIIGKGPGCGDKSTFIEEEPVDNEVEVSAYQILSGGLLG